MVPVIVLMTPCNHGWTACSGTATGVTAKLILPLTAGVHSLRCRSLQCRSLLTPLELLPQLRLFLRPVNQIHLEFLLLYRLHQHPKQPFPVQITLLVQHLQQQSQQQLNQQQPLLHLQLQPPQLLLRLLNHTAHLLPLNVIALFRKPTACSEMSEQIEMLFME